MKMLFTSLLLLSMTMSQAATNPVDSSDKGKKNNNTATKTEVVANPATPALSAQQLQEENLKLKALVFALENRLEEEKGMLQFNFTMLNMLSKIQEDRYHEKVTDLQSKLMFNQVMSNTLDRIKEEKHNEKVADLQSNITFSQLMSNLLQL
nr:hypothetical protein [Chitinophagaceae bacterium]